MIDNPDYSHGHAAQDAGNARLVGADRPTRRIDGFVSRVAELTVFTQSLSERLGRVNDHLYGIEPEPGTDGVDEPPMNGSYDQLTFTLSHLGNALRVMDHQITRAEEHS